MGSIMAIFIIIIMDKMVIINHKQIMRDYYQKGELLQALLTK